MKLAHGLYHSRRRQQIPVWFSGYLLGILGLADSINSVDETFIDGFENGKYDFERGYYL